MSWQPLFLHPVYDAQDVWLTQALDALRIVASR